MQRTQLERLLAEWLAPDTFTDDAENGLQVEGRAEIRRVVCGVSANLALIEAAIEKDAEAVIVHHGLVWSAGIRRVTGWLGQRVRRLIQADVSLFAYHLPLDAHPRLGNNAGLADAIGLTKDRSPFGEYKGQKIGFAGSLAQPRTLADLAERLASTVGEPLALFGDGGRLVTTVAVCSGGATDLFGEAIRDGVDLYVTGEPGEWVKSVAEESGVAFMALGHHATERFGVQRLAAELTESAGLTADFVEIANPV